MHSSILLSFFCLTVFGLPANLTIAWRLWKQLEENAISLDDEKQPFGPLSLVEGIRIEKQVEIAVDCRDIELDHKEKLEDYRNRAFDDCSDAASCHASDQAHFNTAGISIFRHH